MKFDLDPNVEYKMQSVDLYTSVHGFPAMRVHLMSVDNKKSGWFTMAVTDVRRLEELVYMELSKRKPQTE